MSTSRPSPISPNLPPPDATTYGKEEESRTVDRLTFLGVPKGGEIANGESELNDDAVERVSGIVTSIADLRKQHLRFQSENLLAAKQADYYPALTSVPLDGSRSVLTDKPRYQELGENLGTNANVTVTGMHIHVNVEDPDRRASIRNEMAQYEHVFIALTASSPIYAGYLSRYVSNRVMLLQEMHSYQDLRLSHDWESYQEAMEVAMDNSLAAESTRVHPGTRAVERQPTLENRTGDNGLTLEDRLFADYLAIGLVSDMVIEREQGRGELTVLHEPLGYRAFRTRAALHGMKSTLRDPLTNLEAPAWDVAHQLFRRVRRGLSRVESLQGLPRNSVVREFDSLVTGIKTKGTGADRITAMAERVIKSRISKTDLARFKAGVEPLDRPGLEALMYLIVHENQFGSLTSRNKSKNAAAMREIDAEQEMPVGFNESLLSDFGLQLNGDHPSLNVIFRPTHRTFGETGRSLEPAAS